MEYIEKDKHKTFFFISIIFFILFYPMFISIYVFLPLFIGASSYFLIEGLEQEKSKFIFFSSVYLLNLEINLSLPLFLTIISSFLFYITIYPYLRHFRRCLFCKAIFSVVFLDLFYLGALFTFDFIFQTHSIELDALLLYTLIVDVLIVVLI
jgi:hypothetical protein